MREATRLALAELRERQVARATHGAAAAGARAAADHAGRAGADTCSSDLWQDIRYAARMFCEAARLRRRGHPHARARHRRQHRHLQRGLRRAAEAAAVPRARAPGQRDAHCASAGLRRSITVRPRISPIATISASFEDIGAWESQRCLDHGARRSGAGRGAVGQRRHAAAAERAAAARTAVHQRR